MPKNTRKQPSKLRNFFSLVKLPFMFVYYLIAEIRYRKALKNYKRTTGKNMPRRMTRDLQKQYHLTTK